MSIVDQELLRREDGGRPVRVAMVGSGTMGRAIANQIVNYTKGMRLVAVLNRTIKHAVDLCEEVGIESSNLVHVGGDRGIVEQCEQLKATSKVSKGGKEKVMITDNMDVLFMMSEWFDIILEVTGTIDFAAEVCLKAFENKKDVVLMNAELDGTLGPILKTYADRAQVILSGCDGDQPGVEVNLYRYVKQMGLQPLVCGNIKGFHNIRGTPATQAEFAGRWAQSCNMVTSFCDGTKVSFEQAIVANAVGMTISKRGMNGFQHTGHVDELTQVYDVEEIKKLGGIVDYVVGAKPAPGIYILATCDDPKQKHLLEYYKLGKGPLYSFYTPYHLCHLEVPMSLARVALFRDVVFAPQGAPLVDVIATAKVDLEVGDVLDSFGGFKTYGLCEQASVVHRDRLLPIGLTEGCRVIRRVPRDQVLSYDDVEIPAGRLMDKLREEQNERFFGSRVKATCCEHN